MREIPKDKRSPSPPAIKPIVKEERPQSSKELKDLVELNKNLLDSVNSLTKVLTQEKPKKSYDSFVHRDQSGKIIHIETKEV